jgi:hypothetical protein
LLPKTSTAFREGHTKMALHKKALHEMAPIKMALQKKPPFIWNLFRTNHQCSRYNNHCSVVSKPSTAFKEGHTKMAQQEKAPIKMDIQNKSYFELKFIQKLKSVVWIQP